MQIKLLIIALAFGLNVVKADDTNGVSQACYDVSYAPVIADSSLYDATTETYTDAGCQDILTNAINDQTQACTNDEIQSITMFTVVDCSNDDDIFTDDGDDDFPTNACYSDQMSACNGQYMSPDTGAIDPGICACYGKIDFTDCTDDVIEQVKAGMDALAASTDACPDGGEIPWAANNGAPSDGALRVSLGAAAAIAALML